MSTTRQGQLQRLAELVRDLHQLTPPEGLLDELTEGAVQWVPGAQYAGITVTRRRSDIETAAATGSYPLILDDIQRRHREGPCLSAAWAHQTIRIDDLAVDDRWPRYCADAIAQTPIRSMLCFQLFGQDQAVGALNFFSEGINVFDNESVELGLVFATHAALVWNMQRRDEQFRSALASRDIIGQAKGMLMERYRIDAVAAFDLLRRLSQESNVPLAQIAQQVVHADHPSH
ncbi:hypothetical protein BST20_24630 [Mycobacterium branderi]|uniref:ANTAR domain-containing protein n=1 Tax=Mycobacterium branderi TaxID=43348 RepID=A0AA91LSW8_9MYCO|nr:GAF and ANTAR domain-containing protein [Mycobacterium branderi]ORA32615.1 hypothetical protein BST20_24630 [Mycobacterium branderi]